MSGLRPEAKAAPLNLLKNRDAFALLTAVSLVSYFLEGVSLYVITGAPSCVTTESLALQGGEEVRQAS